MSNHIFEMYLFHPILSHGCYCSRSLLPDQGAHSLEYQSQPRNRGENQIILFKTKDVENLSTHYPTYLFVPNYNSTHTALFSISFYYNMYLYTGMLAIMYIEREYGLIGGFFFIFRMFLKFGYEFFFCSAAPLLFVCYKYYLFCVHIDLARWRYNTTIWSYNHSVVA